MRVGMPDQAADGFVPVEVDVVVVGIDALGEVHIDHRADDNMPAAAGQADGDQFVQFAFKGDRAFGDPRGRDPF